MAGGAKRKGRKQGEGVQRNVEWDSCGGREGGRPTTVEGSGKSIDDTPLERAAVCVAMVLSCKHANTVRRAEGKTGFARLQDG